MSAKWAKNFFKSPELPIIQQTLISLWLPWKFLLVSTVQLDTPEPSEKLTESMDEDIIYEDISSEDVPPETTRYVTQVFHCNRHLKIKSFEEPLFEKQYTDIFQAMEGHDDVVKIYAGNCSILNPPEKKR